MAGLRVLVNEHEVASVSNDGLNLISLRVSGDVVGDELAVVELTGGNYSGEGTTHLTWISGRELSEDDVVEVLFLEDIQSSHTGKTIEELFPDYEENELPSQSIDEIFSDLSIKPKQREGHKFHLTLPDGEVRLLATDQKDFSFGFSVMWKWIKPNEASVWLTSNSLEGVRDRADGTTHAKLRLHYGESVQIRTATNKI